MAADLSVGEQAVGATQVDGHAHQEELGTVAVEALGGGTEASLVNRLFGVYA